MGLPSDLVKLIPESNNFDFRLLHGDEKTAAIEQAYSRNDGGGFVGCFVSHDEDSPGWQTRIANYCRDEFLHDTPGPKFFSEVVEDLPPLGDEGRHVYSSDTFAAFTRDSAYQTDRPFSITQNYGICVDSSGTYLTTYLLGYRAMRPQFREALKYLAAHYLYANRGYCGHGWTMGAWATQAKQNGWCPAMQIEVGGQSLDWDEEDEHETTAASRWCRSGIPGWLSTWTRENFAWDPSGITYFDGGTHELKQLFAAGGVFHHGSNHTSGSRKPNQLTRIGGHAQPAMGGDWSEETIKWFRDEHGITYTQDDFPCPQGQQWGPNWSGRLDPKYWPTHRWGPMPEGSWLISSKQLLSGKFDGYAYLPKLTGVPGSAPVPLPDKAPEIDGSLVVEATASGFAIRGEIEIEGYSYIAVPDGSGRYRFVQRFL